MNEHLNNSELVSKLAAAEQKIAELERALARTSRRLSDKEQGQEFQKMQMLNPGITLDVIEQVRQPPGESEARYQSLFENTPVAIWEEDFSAVRSYLDDLKSSGVTDLDAHFTAHEQALRECVELIRVTDVNQAALILYGASSKAQLLGSLGNTFPREALKGFKNELLMVARGGSAFRSESLVRTFHGNLREVAIDWSVAPGYEQTYAKVLVTLSDITDLRQAQEKYADIFENSAEGLFQSSPEGRFLKVNPAMARIYGYASPQEMLANVTNITEQLYLTPRDREQFTALFTDQDSVLNFEMKNYRKDRSIIWTSTSARAVRDANGRILYYEGFLQDITDRKQAAEARQEAELRYRALFEQSHDAIFILDLEGRHLDVNQRAADMLGYALEELFGLSVRELSVESAQSQQVLQKLMTGEHVSIYERLFRKKDGSIIPVEINVELIRDAHGDPLHIQSVVRDITDRRRAEIELKRRNEDLGLINAINEVIVQGGNLDAMVQMLEKQLNHIFSIHGTSIYLLSPDGRSLTMQQYAMPSETTRKIEKLIGSTIPIIQIPIREGGLFERVLTSRQGSITSDPKEIQNWIAEFAETSFLPPVVRSAVRKLIPRIYKLLNIKSTIVVPLISNGRTIGLLDVSSSGLLTTDDLKRIESIGVQLTAAIQRQQAQQKIQRSEEFLNSIQNALSASIAILDETGVIVRVNAAWRKFGEQNGQTDPDDCIGQNYLEICDSASGPNAQEAPVIAKAIREVIISQRKEAWVEYPCHSPEEERWFVLRITRFEDGDRVWVVLAHENITERKQAENSLRRSEAILAQAGKMAHLGAWEIVVRNSEDLNDNPLRWSDEVYRIFGYEPGGIDLTNDIFFERVHPNDRQKVEETMSQAIAEKKPYEVEHRIIRPDGVERIVEERADLIFDASGRLVQVLGATQDITERKEAEEQLRQSEHRYRTVVDNQTEFIVRWKNHGVRTFVNEAYCRYFEITPEQALFTSFVPLIHAEDRPAVEEKISRLISGISKVETETHRVIRPDGSIGWQEWTDQAVYDNRGQLIEFQSVGRDVTERIKVEQNLKETSEQFRTLFEASPEAIMLVDPHGDWPILDCNATACSINGYTRKELIGQTIDILTPTPGDAAGRLEYLENIRKAGILRYDNFHRHKDGRIFPIETSASLIILGGREVILGIDRDITERKLAESALRESEHRYRALFEDLPVAIWEEDFSEVKRYLDLLKEQGITDFRAYFEAHPEVVLECNNKIRILDVNNTALRMYGADSKEQLLKSMDLAPSQAELEQVHEALIHIVEGKLSHSWECSDATFAGEQIEINLAMSVSPGYEKNYSRVIVTTTDITQRKLAEERLSQERERAQNYLDIAGVLMLAVDQTGTVTMINQKGCEILGYSYDEIIGKDWIQTFLPEAVREEMKGVFMQLMHGESELLGYYENVILTRNGEERLIAWHNTLVHDSEGMVITSLSSGEDITERRRAEEKLRSSEERFRQLADNIQEAFWITDATSGEEIYASPATEKIWGRPLQSIMHEPNLFIESVVLEDRPAVQQVLEIQKGGKHTEMEYRITHPDGSVRWIWDRAFPIFDDSGKVVRLAGVAADITERKQAEEALHQSELKYRNLVETSHDLIWSVDGDGLFTYLNQASRQIYGYEPEELIGHPFFELMDQQSSPRDLDEFRKTIADKDKFVDAEAVVRHRDGRQIILSANSLVLRDEYNHVMGVVGTSRDITERKQAEEQLRKLSRAVEQSASTIVITDTSGQIEYVNPKFTAISGYTLEEALGQNPRILRSGLTAREVYADLWKSITSGAEWHGELLNRKKNGDLYWEAATISPILNERGETTHFIAVKEDITERKKNESDITRHLAELEALYENGLAVGRLLEPSAIGQRIIQTFSQYLSWHHVTIRLRKEHSEELELIALQLPHVMDGTLANEEQHIKSLVSRVGQGLSGWVVQTGSPVRTNNLPENPYYVKTYEGMQSGLYMPLKVGDRIIGVISVESEQPEAFSEQDERLLATLANQAATAFENARLYQAAQQELWDRRVAEEALRQSEENYRRLALELEARVYERTAEVQDLYDNAPCGYHSLDQEGRIIRINQTELKWLGYTPEEVVGNSFQDFITEESRHTFTRTFPEFKQHGFLRDLELEMLRKDGSIFPTLISATAVYDKEGRYLTSRSTLFDDTERKHALETLRLANSEMKRAMRMKDEFLANMSHELRTPLNAILGLSESLLEQTAGPINEKQQKYLGTVNESGRHLLELINDILDLAKIESGQIKIDPTRVNINTACETSLRMIKQLSQKKNQTVEVEIENEIGHVWADERRLKQMMVNLLSNAVKFTPEGGQLGLKARIDRKEMNLLITIWDRGIGIREQDLKRLFRPFVQLDSSLSRESTGTGLGLALVAEMARLHGGSVSVSSQPGEGSQFTIVLPWDPAITNDTIDKLKITGKIPIMRRSAVDKPTILMVEDTESVVLMLRDYLELSGYQVVIATDGLEGVSKAIMLQPDLILMDVQMPSIDGLEATRQIRKEASLKDTPIIALTALAMPSDRERCLQAGMSDYFSKPINLKELAKAIQRHLPDSGTGKKYEYDPHRR